MGSCFSLEVTVDSSHEESRRSTRPPPAAPRSASGAAVGGSKAATNAAAAAITAAAAAAARPATPNSPGKPPKTGGGGGGHHRRTSSAGSSGGHQELAAQLRQSAVEARIDEYEQEQWPAEAAAAAGAAADGNNTGAAAAALVADNRAAIHMRPRRVRVSDLRVATNDFHESRELGQGSFGKVYLGTLVTPGAAEGLAGRKEEKVAVKQLNPESFQGFDEWIAEVLTLDRVRHPFLVRLVGYAAEGGECLLAYELCEGGSLESALFPEDESKLLSWSDRIRIAQECSQALAHLHDNNIIHRDLKPSNILLTKDLSTRLTDFGLAKEAADGQTHLSTRVMGTMGYLDPGYLESGKLREESDVYSYGVILLQLITGREAMGVDGKSLTQWVRPYFNQRMPDLDVLVDSRMSEMLPQMSVAKLLVIAKHCLNQDYAARPKMKVIAKNLQLLDST